MKPLHLMSRYGDDIRPRRATAEQIRECIERPDSSDRLVRVTVDEDGDLTATPLTADEVKALASELDAMESTQLRALLDDALAYSRRIEKHSLRGVTAGWGRALTIWPEEAPYAEAIVREWADANNLHVSSNSMPTKGEEWIRTVDVSIDEHHDHRPICHLQWPSIKIGQTAIAVEAMCIAIATLGEQPKWKAQPSMEAF